MRRTYIGQSPCPGCGRPGEKSHRESKDKVCYDCKRLMKLGAGVVTVDKSEVARFNAPTYSLSGRLTAMRYTGSDSERVGSFDGPLYISDLDHPKPGNSRSLAKGLTEILKTIHLGTFAAYSLVVFGPDSHETDHFTVRPDTAMAIAKFIGLIGHHSKRTYLDGFNDGKNLLMGLQSGKLTLEQFEDHVNDALKRLDQEDEDE